jgi:neutral ceramidase
MLLLLLACTGPEGHEFPDKVPGPPVAGAAEGLIDLPVGAPLGGYSSRCSLLGSDGKQDDRKSHYRTAFSPTTGIVTRPWVKGLYLENGDDQLMLFRLDAIYSYDGLVAEVGRRLTAETGVDFNDKVVISTSHTHNQPANFSDQVHFYLGGDKYNREIFERYVDAFVAVGLDAFNAREDAAIGTHWVRDWDPDDRVYRDRREDNDELVIWDDWTPGRYKDPYANILRVDAVDGRPIAMVVTFGMHGTILGGDNPMWSNDSTGGVEMVLEEQFDEPVVVMHLQGAGGDASPAGRDHDYARAESIGHFAVDALMAAYEDTPTGSEPFSMETASRHIPQALHEIQVTRNGTVDWTYRPYEEDYEADDKIYDANGDILSPIDEYNAQYGAAFCGSDAPLIPVGNIGSQVFPYSACMDVELMAGVIAGTFKMPIEEFPLPMPESLKAGTTASLWGPIPTRTPEGDVVDRDFLVGFFPAEPTAMYSEQWRRRAEDELGVEMALLVGYSQDHEGYFLLPEDWLLGGYEPNINVWGPLQGEHVMEGVLTMSDDVLMTPAREDSDPLGLWGPTEYADKPLPELEPDTSPNAGSLVTEAPEYTWLPPGFELELSVPETCPRVSCAVQLAWVGGDPAVDLPKVVLERLDGDTWTPVTSAAGRVIDEAQPDIVLSHTPEPLYPADADQTHRWWAAWQSVGHVHDLMGVPLGTYRLTVSGHSYVGGDATWPWTTEEYFVTSEPFEVVAGEIVVESLGEGSWGASISAPSSNWRLVSMEGDSRGRNPVEGPLLVDGTEVAIERVEDGRAVFLWEGEPATVEDRYNNAL